MRRLLLTTAILLAGCNPGLAQVSTMGTTAMGIPSMPGAIVTSPLNGPSPFSATTQPGALDTTLAPVSLASDPTTPGTVVTCSTPTGQIAIGTLPVLPAASALPPHYLTLPMSSTVPNTVATSIAGSTAITFPATPPGTIPILGSTTGTISPLSPLGSSSTTVCSSVPGGPPTHGAALPLSTPEIQSGPPLGAIQPVISELGDTSIDPDLAVVPTPNSAVCRERVTMSLANPSTMAPANTTGAIATPGVSSASPLGC
jgi:hypothetical protein